MGRQPILISELSRTSERSVMFGVSPCAQGIRWYGIRR